MITEGSHQRDARVYHMHHLARLFQGLSTTTRTVTKSRFTPTRKHLKSLAGRFQKKILSCTIDRGIAKLMMLEAHMRNNQQTKRKDKKKFNIFFFKFENYFLEN